MSTDHASDDIPVPVVNVPMASGPAYSRGHKILLVLLLLMLTAWGARLALQPDTWRINRDLLLWAAAGYGLLLAMGWTMLRSTTTVSEQALEQTWFWRKHVRLDQISHARFVRWRGLEWLIAPRLYVRTGPGPVTTYYGASPALWRSFEAMSAPFKR